MIKRRTLALLTGCAAVLALLGASGMGSSAQTLIAPPAHVQPTDATDKAEPLPLLVPYRGLMVGMIDWSSYGIFQLATNGKPLTDSDWNAAGLAAVNLIAISSLLTTPNSNADDHRRLADPAWLGLAADFQNASVMVAMSVEGRNRSDFSRTADLLADTCQACHDKFRVLPPKDTSQFAKR